MTTLRQRIRKIGISPQPWKVLRGEIGLLPVSAQTLFKNSGLPFDILEMELVGEGWMTADERLFDVLSTKQGLSRKLSYDADPNEEPWDDTWTDEDFIHFYNKEV